MFNDVNVHVVLLVVVKETMLYITMTYCRHLQVTSPYPLSVTRTSSPSSTKVTYRLSLLPDYHCPPEPPFIDLNITFYSILTHQEEYVSVSFLESDLSCPVEVQATPSAAVPYPPRAKETKNSLSASLTYLLVAFLILLLVVMVICMALSKSSTHTRSSGFSEHLPPNHTSPQHHALSPSQATPMSSQPPSMHYQSPTFNQRQTPMSATPSVAMPSTRQRTPFSSSPGQHGLFSQ